MQEVPGEALDSGKGVRWLGRDKMDDKAMEGLAEVIFLCHPANLEHLFHQAAAVLAQEADVPNKSQKPR